MKSKYDTSRPSPPYSATLFNNGYIAYGNDGDKWIIKSTSKGVKRWTKFEKTDHESHMTPKKKSKRKSPKKSKTKSPKKSKTKSPKKSKPKSPKKSKTKSPKKSKTKSPKKSRKLEPFNLDRLKKLCVKYKVQTHGSKATIAERLSSLRGSYLTKNEKRGIKPYLKNNKNKKLLMKSMD